MGGKLYNYLKNRQKSCSLLLLVIFIILLYLFVGKDNSKIVLELLPFILIFILGGFLFDKEYLSSYITVISIISAILFFLFQNSIIQENKFDTILIINKDSCETADQLIFNYSNISKESINLIEGYVVNIYKDNIAFIYNKFGKENGKKILEITNDMEAVNAIIRMSQYLLISNTDIKDLSLPEREMLEKFGEMVKEFSTKIKGVLKEVSKDYKGYENICN